MELGPYILAVLSGLILAFAISGTISGVLGIVGAVGLIGAQVSYQLMRIEDELRTRSGKPSRNPFG